MLSDDARKVLAIVWSTHHHTWADLRRDIPMIVHRSGRDERRVRAALNELVKEGYLEHQDGMTRVLWSSQLDRERHVQQLQRAWLMRD